MIPTLPGQLPDGFVTTRRSLHQLAFFVIARRRYEATGRMGLRWTPGGFGTPTYATDRGDEQLRMEGDLLVVEAGGDRRDGRPETLADALDLVGLSYREQWFDTFHDPLAPIGPGSRLEIDAAAARAVGDWFGFTTGVLEDLRLTEGAEDVGIVQLWPEHFDPAVELGDADAGRRASYGGSPGDDAHPEPYLYVSPWAPVERTDPFWNARSFAGAVLPWTELVAASDPRAAALAFLRRGHELLGGA